jgi:hypothetical protein
LVPNLTQRFLAFPYTRNHNISNNCAIFNQVDSLLTTEQTSIEGKIRNGGRQEGTGTRKGTPRDIVVNNQSNKGNDGKRYRTTEEEASAVKIRMPLK